MRVDPYWDKVTFGLTCAYYPGTQNIYDLKGNQPVMMDVLGVIGTITKSIAAPNTQVLFSSVGGQGLKVAPSDGFKLGTGDFTFDGWFCPTSTTNAYLFDFRNSAGGAGINIRINGSNLILALGSADILSAPITMVPGAYGHMAVSRVAGTTYLFWNGVVVGSTTIAINSTDSTLTLVGYGFTGYSTNFRVTKGVGRWTSKFQPPLYPLDTAVAADDYFSSVVLSLPMRPTYEDAYTDLVALYYKFEETELFGRDSSKNGIHMTQPGVPSVTSKVGNYGSSCTYNSSTDRPSIPVDSRLVAPAGTDFTFEYWYYHTENSNGYFYSNGGGDYIVTAGNGYLAGAPADVIGSVPVTKGNWYHVAVVRAGDTYTAYVNGTAILRRVVSGTSWTPGGVVFCSYGPSAQWLTGVVDQIRYTLGLARYTTNFTPTADFTQGVSGTSNYRDLLNKQEGACFASRAHPRKGDTSYYFDGATGRLAFSPIKNFNLLADFTLEGWFYWSMAGSQYRTLVSQVGKGSDNSNKSFALQICSTGVKFVYSTDGATTNSVEVPTSITSGLWTHIAVSRVGSTLYLFIGGRLIGSGPMAGALFPSTADLVFGTYGRYFEDGGLTDSSFQGYLDEWRFTNGVGRYTSSVPVLNPVSPTSYVSGYVKEAGNVVAGRVVRAYDRESGKLVGSASSNEIGFFFIEVPVDMPVYVVAIDPDGGTEYNALIFDRIIPAAT